MRLYLNVSIKLCKITRTHISFLLHPLDLIGGDQISQLAFFPGMNVSSDKKVRVFQDIIRLLQKHYEMVNMSRHFAFINKNKKMDFKKLK